MLLASDRYCTTFAMTSKLDEFLPLTIKPVVLTRPKIPIAEIMAKGNILGANLPFVPPGQQLCRLGGTRVKRKQDASIDKDIGLVCRKSQFSPSTIISNQSLLRYNGKFFALAYLVLARRICRDLSPLRFSMRANVSNGSYIEYSIEGKAQYRQTVRITNGSIHLELIPASSNLKSTSIVMRTPEFEQREESVSRSTENQRRK
jgi:hypothetical protein